MRKIFHQYFRPTREELTELWQQGLLSFDASVLLNVYGYSKKTRDELVEFIEKYSERVRLPYQSGLEFARNRSAVIVKQVHNYTRVTQALEKIWNVDIAPKRDHPYLSKRSTRAFKAIMKELEDGCRAMEKLVGSDPYADRMFDIFEGRVGKAPTTEALCELEAIAQTRYGKLIPPGFADLKEKGSPAASGDFIAWHQLMEIAKEEEKGVILVTDDMKEDWWLLEGSRTVGPLPHLIEEFTRITNQRFYMYNSETFLRAAREFAAADIRDDVIEEVTERRASVSAALRAALVKSVPVERENPRVKKRVPESTVSGSDVKQPPAPIVDNKPSPEKFGPRRD
jgi:hypothetical protein